MSGLVVLVVAELVALFRGTTGCSITQKTKATPITHAAMGSLTTWSSYHFVGSELVPDSIDRPRTDLAVALAGGLAGLFVHRYR